MAKFLDESGLAELWELVKDQDDIVKALANSKAQIATGSYTGTGTYGESNPNSLTFGFEAKLVLVANDTFYSFMVNGNQQYWPMRAGSGTWWTGAANNGYVTFSASGVSFYNPSDDGYQMNASGTTYRYFALY